MIQLSKVRESALQGNDQQEFVLEGGHTLKHREARPNPLYP